MFFSYTFSICDECAVALSNLTLLVLYSLLLLSLFGLLLFINDLWLVDVHPVFLIHLQQSVFFALVLVLERASFFAVVCRYSF